MTPEKCIAELKNLPFGSRITSQRMMILDYLRCVRTHPTAEQIYLSIKRKLPRISLGTVYRNLSFLNENGYIIEVLGKDNRVHYDGHVSGHAHFICERCGRIYDIEIKEKKEKFPKLKFGVITSRDLNYYGSCRKCKKKIINK